MGVQLQETIGVWQGRPVADAAGAAEVYEWLYGQFWTTNARWDRSIKDTVGILEERFMDPKGGTVPESPWASLAPRDAARGSLLVLHVKAGRRAEVLAVLAPVCGRLHLTLWDPARGELLAPG